MNRFDKRKVAIDKAIREQIEQYKSIYKTADGEDRDPTDEERLDIESHLKAIETLRTEKDEVEANLKTLQHVDDIGRELGPTSMSVLSEPQDRAMESINRAFPLPQGYGAFGQKSLGLQFIESKGYQESVRMYRESGRLPSGFSTGPVALEMKGTFGESGGGVAIGGGAFVSVPQVVPGVVEKLFQRLTISDLLLQGQATTNSIRYVVEGTATSGAAGVTEGGQKPESALGLTTTDEAIKKIATVLPVSEEMLEDGPAIQSYINGRLTLFVQIEEERQLFRGASGGAEVQGLLTSRSVPVYTGGTADNKAEQLFKALNSMRGSALIEPEWVVLHPTDWQTIRLLKDTAQQYYGGGPFLGQYGNNGQVSPGGGQIDGAQDSIWNKPVYVTAGIGGAGTALIGTRAGAQVWRRGGLSVEATNSHSNFFALNLVAIRAEERVGLAVYRPSGYVEARLAVGPGG